MKKRDSNALTVDRIFSGKYSEDMWAAINEAKTKADLQGALYLVCVRLQELESRIARLRK